MSELNPEVPKVKNEKDSKKEVVKKDKEVLTRAEFVMELMNKWERNLDIASRKGLSSVASRLKTAITVLKNSYGTDELVNLEELK
jgi:hypothetical protein